LTGGDEEHVTVDHPRMEQYPNLQTIPKTPGLNTSSSAYCSAISPRGLAEKDFTAREVICSGEF
jgi:hypothetical protein